MPVERIWPEVNARVNYPIKQILVNMDNDGIIDMDNESHKFSVSSVGCVVASYGLHQVVLSWNEHPIAGKKKSFSRFFLKLLNVSVFCMI